MDSGDVRIDSQLARAGEPRASRGWTPIILIVIALLAVLLFGLLTLQWSLTVLPTFALVGVGIGVLISQRRARQSSH